MTSRNIEPDISYKIHEALSNAMNEDGTFLNRWIVMAEHIYEGGATVAYVTSPGLGTWEVLGMVEATKIVATEHMLGQYDDDDDEEED